MRQVFIVLVYKKRVSCRCSNGPTAQSMGMARLMPGKHKSDKTTAYVVISELEDYGTMPTDPATSNCDLRNVHEYSSAMLSVISRVVLPAKLIYYIYYD